MTSRNVGYMRQVRESRRKAPPSVAKQVLYAQTYQAKLSDDSKKQAEVRERNCKSQQACRARKKAKQEAEAERISSLPWKKKQIEMLKLQTDIHGNNAQQKKRLAALKKCFTANAKDRTRFGAGKSKDDDDCPLTKRRRKHTKKTRCKHKTSSKRSKSKHKRTISAFKQSELANNNYWKSLLPIHDVDYRMNLMVFVPARSSISKYSAGTFRNKFRLDSNYNSDIDKVFVIPRLGTHTQLLFQLNMHEKLHGKGTIGQCEAFVVDQNSRRDKTCRRSRKTPVVVEIPNDKDIMFNPSNDNADDWPVVINTPNLKCPGSNEPLTDKFHDLIKCLVVEHFDELVSISEVNTNLAEKRLRNSVAFGITSQRADSYRRDNDFQVGMAGTIKNDNISKECMKRVGEVVEFLCQVPEVALKGTPHADFFKYSRDNDAPRFTLFMRELEEEFQLTIKGSHGRLSTSIQINFGKELSVHYDVSDDTNNNFNGHLSGTTQLGEDDVPVEIYSKMKKHGLLNSNGKLSITAIAFNNKVVSNQVMKTIGEGNDNKEDVRVRGTSDSTDPAVRMLKAMYFSSELDLQDIGRFHVSDPDVYITELFEIREDDKRGEFAGNVAKPKEGPTKELYFASTLHVALLLLSTMTIIPTSYHTLRQIVFIASHQNGQELLYTIFTAWSNDEFVCHYGNKCTFEQRYTRNNNNNACPVRLLTMFYEHLRYLLPTQKRPSTNDYRFQVNGIWLYDPKHPQPDFENFLLQELDKMDSALAVLQQGECCPLQLDWNLGHRSYMRMQGVSGFGHAKALQCIQFASRFGLVPRIYCEFGVIDGKLFSKCHGQRIGGGPGVFLRHQCVDCGVGKRCSCAKEVVEERYLNIVAELQEDPELRGMSHLICENGLCIQWRMRDGDHRKRDLVFFDRANDKMSIQNFLVYDSIRKMAKGTMRMLYGGRWHPLDELWLVHTNNIDYINDRRKAGFFQWQHPSWARKQTYPRDSFAMNNNQ